MMAPPPPTLGDGPSYETLHSALEDLTRQVEKMGRRLKKQGVD